jgi:hypothetical protein
MVGDLRRTSVSHALRPYNSIERRLIQGGDNYDSDNYEDGVCGQDEAEFTRLTRDIPYDSTVYFYANMVVSTLELNLLKNDQTAL